MFNHKEFLENLSQKAGVYCMRDNKDEVLYIGKAKNLKRRVSSYFNKSTNNKVSSLISKIASIDVTLTPSEREALLLECTLIKELKPKYNVILKDDKSYPYVYISTNHNFPRLNFFRGVKSSKGRYFGPFTSSAEVKDSIKLMQNIFKLRTCTDVVLNNRSRPCLLYQIKLCSAPCVSKIKEDDYQNDVNRAIQFLEGKNTSIIHELIDEMNKLSADERYEDAAIVRDKIQALRHIQEQQSVKGGQDTDIISCVIKENIASICVIPVRRGSMLQARTYYPKVTSLSDEQTIIRNFLLTFYLNRPYTVANIILSHTPEDLELISGLISEKTKQKINIITNPRSKNKAWLQMATENAKEQLKSRLNVDKVYLQRLEEFTKVVCLESTPKRIECFDVSHMQGKQSYASCVVFDDTGPKKDKYRLFKLALDTNGDDYKGMQEALTRRFEKKTENLPDVLIIDGGVGQLGIARSVLADFGLSEDILLMGIAKGEGRKPGLETIFITKHDNTNYTIIDNKRSDYFVIDLGPQSKALLFMQRIRDEAHRFAIKAHRAAKTKTIQSPLEKIPGIGAAKRQAIISYFGGFREVSGASIEEIAKVPGIGLNLAAEIYKHLHDKK